ncbi:MAG TPA: hypothetical protein VIK44_04780 [Acetobacterium sp.]
MRNKEMPFFLRLMITVFNPIGVIQRDIGVEYLKYFLNNLPIPPFRGDGQKHPF